MALSRGINSYIGYGAEATFGTADTADLFNRIIDCSLRHVKDPFFSESLNPDWHQQLYYGQGRVEGSIVMENVYTGQELFWHSLFGTYTYTNDSPVAGTDTHAFTYAPSTNAHPSMSIETYLGMTGATARKYAGCYVQKATLEFAPNQTSRVTFDIVGQSVSVVTAVASSFPTFLPVLPAHKQTLTIGGNTFTILSGTMEIEVARATDREHYGDTNRKEAVVVGRPMAMINLECEYDDTTNADSEQLQQDFEAGTAVSGFVLNHSGDIITGATNYQQNISATEIYLTEPVTPSGVGEQVTAVSVRGRVTDGLSMTLINDTNEVT